MASRLVSPGWMAHPYDHPSRIFRAYKAAAGDHFEWIQDRPIARRAKSGSL